MQQLLQRIRPVYRILAFLSVRFLCSFPGYAEHLALIPASERDRHCRVRFYPRTLDRNGVGTRRVGVAASKQTRLTETVELGILSLSTRPGP